MKYDRYRSSFFITTLCIATIVFTVLTQIPEIEVYMRPVMYACWLGLLIIGCIVSSSKIRITYTIIGFIVAILIISIECGLCNILINTHLDSYFLRVIPLPFFCYLTVYLISNYINSDNWEIIIGSFITVTLVAFLYIFRTYIGSISEWLLASVYLYADKNSAAQIIGCAIVFCSFLITPKKKLLILLKYTALAVLILLLVVMQCRTALVSVILAFAAYYVFKLKGKKRFLVTTALVVLAVYVLVDPTLSQYITKAFVINSRQVTNLNSFTSGRMQLYKEAWEIFCNSPLFGTGHFRVDDLYLAVLSDIGIIGFVPVIILWISRIIINVSLFYDNKNNSFYVCLFCLTVFYIGESVFEAYPPFGPGVCAFMFWAYCAVIDNKREYLYAKEH